MNVNTALIERAFPGRWGCMLALWLVLTAEVFSASLADFGYGCMRLGGTISTNSRPLVVIIADFSAVGVPPLAHTTNEFEQFVFDTSTTNGLNSYLWENSNGRFRWANAGIIGPLTNLTASDMLTNWEAFGASIGDVHLGESMFFSNIIYKAMLTGFDFARFDNNANKTVEDGELNILIISNTRTNSGQGRWTCRVQTPASSVAVALTAAEVSDRECLNLIAHENTHTLGAGDLYGPEGPLSQNVSVMGCCATPGDIFHLDPWHKMELGWSEPRICSMSTGGVVVLPAAQLMQPNAPVVLYDPAHGVSEFFMLEYRTRTTSTSTRTDYERNLPDDGLVVWYVQEDAAKGMAAIPALMNGPIPGQPGWSWCLNCQGLFYSVNESTSHCPQGTTHVHQHSLPYAMVGVVDDPSTPDEHNWRRCKNCQGLFFGDNQPSSHCPAGPAGTTHNGTSSSDFRLIKDVPTAPGQHAWRRCNKCQGLFFGGGESSSHCPDGGRHDSSGSGDYSMVTIGLTDPGVFAQSPPDWSRISANAVWGSGASTPYLRWLDGSLTTTRLSVRPFKAGADSIVVEFLTDGDTWADFNYQGAPNFPENGAFDYPFNTLAEGVAAVNYGGTLHIKTGSSPESANINKHLNIRAYNGPVNIGR